MHVIAVDIYIVVSVKPCSQTLNPNSLLLSPFLLRKVNLCFPRFSNERKIKKTSNQSENVSIFIS